MKLIKVELSCVIFIISLVHHFNYHVNFVVHYLWEAFAQLMETKAQSKEEFFGDVHHSFYNAKK